MQHFKSKLVKTRYSIHFTCSIFYLTKSSQDILFDLACLFHSTLYFLVSGSNSSSQLVIPSTTSADSTQSYFTFVSTVVKSSLTPSTTSDSIPSSTRRSSASPTSTEQPSSTQVFPSSPAVYSSTKLPESTPVNYSQVTNSTQFYNSNGTPTISIHLELHV